jgi:hypothetical protein
MTAPAPRRWYVGGSDALRMLVRNSLREFGVATYHKSEVSPGGELSQIHMNAPSFHIHRSRHLPHDAGHRRTGSGLGARGRHPHHRRRQRDDEAGDRGGVSRGRRSDAAGASKCRKPRSISGRPIDRRTPPRQRWPNSPLRASLYRPQLQENEVSHRARSTLRSRPCRVPPTCDNAQTHLGGSQ